MQQLGFKTQLDDLGNMSQPLWNTLKGRFMEMSNTPGLPFERMHRFAGHTNFIFLFLVPLYALWSDPQLLLVIQVFLATLAVVPLYLLGRELFGAGSWLSVVGPAVYLLNPILHDAVLYDMHAIVLALPFLLFSIYFLEIKKYRLFIASATLLVLCKEDMPLVLLMLGIWHGLRSKDVKTGAIISSAAAIVFVGLMAVVMPAFRVDVPEQLISRRYEEVGGSISSIIITVMTQPHVIVSIMLRHGLIGYMAMALLGFLFLPLQALISIAAIPTIVINMLSNNPISWQPFGYYYLAPVIGIFSAATVYALDRWSQQPLLNLNQKKFAVVLVVVAVGFSFATSPAPYSMASSWSEFKPDPRLEELAQIKQQIPGTASLSVQNNLGPHLINREDIVRFPYRSDSSDYILVDVTDPYPVLRDKPRQRNFVHITQLWPQEFYDAVLAQLENPEYGVMYAGNGFILFQRGHDRVLNQAAYEMLQDRSKFYFAAYEPVAPVEYREAEFIE